MSTNCKVCAAPLKKIVPTEQGTDYDCPCCGNFTLGAGTADSTNWKEHGNWAALSYAIRRMQRNNQRPLLVFEQIDEILRTKLPAAQQQADNLIIHLGDSINEPSAQLKFQLDFDAPVIGAASLTGVDYIIDALRDQGLLFAAGKTTDARKTWLSLSFAGWERYHELKRSVEEGNQAFMAMKFNDKELDRVYEQCLKPAVEATGFDLRRVDEGQPAGLIDDQLRVRIRAARFLIADLSHANNGVYWEAGFAEGLGKPVIYTCNRAMLENAESQPHFDTNHHLTVAWDVERLDETAEKLKATIRATLPADAKQSDSP